MLLLLCLYVIPLFFSFFSLEKGEDEKKCILHTKNICITFAASIQIVHLCRSTFDYSLFFINVDHRHHQLVAFSDGKILFEQVNRGFFFFHFKKKKKNIYRKNIILLDKKVFRFGINNDWKISILQIIHEPKEDFSFLWIFSKIQTTAFKANNCQTVDIIQYWNS